MKNSNDFNRLTAREQALANPEFVKSKDIITRIDIYNFSGAHITSGYLNNFDTNYELSGDMMIRPLYENDYNPASEDELIGKNFYRDQYLDMKNQLKFFITPVFKPTALDVDQLVSD